MKTAEEWFIEQSKRFLGNGLSMNERIALTREIQQDALASIQQPPSETREWYKVEYEALRSVLNQCIEAMGPTHLCLREAILELNQDKASLDYLEKFLAVAAGNQIYGPSCPIRLSRQHPDWTLKTGHGNCTKTQGCGNTLRLAIREAMKK